MRESQRLARCQFDAGTERDEPLIAELDEGSLVLDGRGMDEKLRAIAAYGVDFGTKEGGDLGFRKRRVNSRLDIGRR